MGNSKYLDSLSSEDYKALTKKLWDIQNHRCFICGEEIDLDINSTNIDHIKPVVTGGKDDETNFALTHENCNKSKQDADLEVARALARLAKILKAAEEKHETPSLKHVLSANNGSLYDFSYKVEGNRLIYAFSKTGDDIIRSTEIFTDKLSNEQTAFIQVPLQYLYHDEMINPRGINSSIGLLIKEFHKGNPQLHISLARLEDNKIRIFDGQHKAVAQIMLGTRELIVRLFLNTDVDRMIETNTIAGSKLKQIAFDKSIVRQLHDTLYAERIKKYQIDHNLPQDNYGFSEATLVDYFKGERGNIRTYIINSQKNLITKNPDNMLQSYINFEGRGSGLPLSYSTFEKTLLSRFINVKTILTTPIDYRADEGLNPRILEKEQLVMLCNILAEELLIGRYNIETGTYRIENKVAEGKDIDISDDHLVAYRIFKEEIMYNWIQYIERLIKNFFSMTGELFDDQNLFQIKFPDQLWTNIRSFVKNFRDLPLWKDRTMASTIFGGKQVYDYWGTVFRTAKTPDGTMVLSKPLNVVDMIK